MPRSGYGPRSEPPAPDSREGADARRTPWTRWRSLPGRPRDATRRPGLRLLVRRRRASNGVPSAPSAGPGDPDAPAPRPARPSRGCCAGRSSRASSPACARPTRAPGSSGDDVLGRLGGARAGRDRRATSPSPRVGLDARSARRWQEVTGHRPSELAAVSPRCSCGRAFRGQGIGASLVDVACADDPRPRAGAGLRGGHRRAAWLRRTPATTAGGCARASGCPARGRVSGSTASRRAGRTTTDCGPDGRAPGPPCVIRKLW